MKIKKIILNVTLMTMVLLSFIAVLRLTTVNGENSDTESNKNQSASQYQAKSSDKTLAADWLSTNADSKLETVQKLIFINNKYDNLLSDYELTFDFASPDATDVAGIKYYFADEGEIADNALVIYNDSKDGKILAPVDSSQLFYGNIQIAGTERNFLGAVEYIYFNDVFEVTASTTNMFSMFKSLESLIHFDSFSNWDTSSVTNFQSSFEYMPYLESLDVSSLDTSSGTNMSYMFKNNFNLKKLDVSNFNTASVTNFTQMFQNVAVSGESNGKKYDGMLLELDLSSFNIADGAVVTTMFLANQKILSIKVPTIGSTQTITLPSPTNQVDDYFYEFGADGLPIGSGTRTLTATDFAVGTQIFVKESYSYYTDISALTTHYDQIIQGTRYLQTDRVLIDSIYTTAINKLVEAHNAGTAFAPSIVADAIADLNAVPEYFELIFLSDGIGVLVQKVRNGSLSKEPAVSDIPSKPNFVLADWLTADGGTVIFDFESVIITEDTRVYAKWANAFNTVTFYGQGANESFPSQTLAYGEKAQVPTDPTRTGYDFLGWYTLPTGGDKFVFYATPITINVSLYAYWQLQEYTVDFEVAGGNESYNDQNIVYGNKISNPGTPTRTGYSFNGWYDAETGGNVFDFTNKIILADTTIYAQWTADTYSESLTDDTGITLSSTAINGEVTFDTTYVLTLTIANFYELNTITITMNNITLTSGDYSVDGNVYTIAKVTGPIVVTITSTDLKQVAKDSLTDYFEQLKDNNPNLSADELTELNDALTDALGKVDAATTTDEMNQAVEDGKAAGNKVIEDAKLNDEKEAAKEELENYYEDLLEKNPNLSTEEKQELEDAKQEAIDKVENSGSKEEVDQAVEDGKTAGNKVIEDAKLEDEKEAAKEQLEDFYEDLLEKNPNLSTEEKQDLEEAKQDAIDKVENAGSKEEVDQAVEDGKTAGDKVITDAEVNDSKEESKDDLDDYFEDLKDKNPGLTEDQLEDLKDALEEEKDKIDQAGSKEEVDQALADAKDAMDDAMNKVTKSVNYFQIIPIIGVTILMGILIFVASKYKKRR